MNELRPMATRRRRIDAGPSRLPRPGQRKLRRAEKAVENRRALLRAGAKVVAKHGYAEASIARIAKEAGLAQGTFYLYFPTRQALLDEVLPFAGERLSEYIRGRVKGASNAFDVEELSFRAAFEFLHDNPGFYRMLNEAEFAAPRGFSTQFDNAASRYLASLRRSSRRGELQGYEPRELEVLVYMLMAVRFYIYLRFVKSNGGKTVRLPGWVVRTYMKFIRSGLNVPRAKVAQRGRM